MPKIIGVGSLDAPACACFSHTVEGYGDHFVSNILRAPGPDELPRMPGINGAIGSKRSKESQASEAPNGHTHLTKVPSNISSDPSSPKRQFPAKVLSNKSGESNKESNKSGGSYSTKSGEEVYTPKMGRRPSIASQSSQLSQISRALSRDSLGSARSSVASLLSEDIAPELLRGISLDRALYNFKFLYHNIVNVDLYGFSESVNHLDDFISHDWKTWRWPKFFTLCLLYNAPAALLASTITGIVLCVLQFDAVGVLPKYSQITPPFNKVLAGKEYSYTAGCWCVFCCPVVFAIFFVNWQYIRSTVLRQCRFVFVDKFCIHQTDMELKATGIRCLAGFLKHSQQLVILWSPRYFTRLWCTYEIASWLHLGKTTQGRQVHLLPIQQSIAVLVISSGTFSFVVVYCVGWRMLSDILSEALVAFLVGAVMLLIFPTPNHMFRRLMRDLRQLPAQLENFSVQNADCFCCSNNHINPDSGEEMSCDREVIYLALSEWFTGDMKEKTQETLKRNASSTSDTDREDSQETFSLEFLDAFDTKVRSQFRQWMGRSSHEASLPYMHCLVAMCPLSWYGFDLAAGMEVLDLDAAARYLFLDMLVLILAMLPAGLHLCFLQLSLVDRFCGVPNSCVLDILVTVAVSVANIITFAVLWIPMLYFLMLSSAVPQLTFDFFLVLLTVWLFKGPESLMKCMDPKGSKRAAKGASKFTDSRVLDRRKFLCMVLLVLLLLLLFLLLLLVVLLQENEQ